MAAAPETESRYRRAVEMWTERDLEGAVAILEAALANSPGPSDDAWWFAVSRALAQIAMERDDLDRARWHLRRLPGFGVGDAMTIALRARVFALAGEQEAAANEVSSAVARLLEDDSNDLGALMNGAIALVWCAEVLAELGYSGAAAGLVSSVRGRTAAAGLDDAAVTTGLGEVEAAVARLEGRHEEALARLEEIDTSRWADVAIQVIRERARIAWQSGDRAGAARLYDDALERCRAAGYPSLEREISEEQGQGPPSRRDAPGPVEEWAARRLEELLGSSVPYAVVVTLVMDNRPSRLTQLEDRVHALLEARPELGHVDGTGADGRIWELFLEGEDPEALWNAVGPLVAAIGPGAGSEVKIRRDRGYQAVPLGD